MAKAREAVFVEASGISEPSSIAGAFLNYEEMTEDTRVYLKAVVSVVDVDRIYREFLHNLTSDEEAEDGDVINLIMDQIEFCNLMILNKTDLLFKEQLKEVKEGLRSLQQEAEMIECVNGNVDLEVLLNREDFDFDEVEAYSAVQSALRKPLKADVKKKILKRCSDILLNRNRCRKGIATIHFRIPDITKMLENAIFTRNGGLLSWLKCRGFFDEIIFY